MKTKKNKKYLKDGSRHVFNYLKNGWNHCAWDFEFLIGIIEAKLNDMEDFFSNEEKTHLANRIQVLGQIKRTRAVLNVAMHERFEFDSKPYINRKNLDKDLLNSLEYTESRKSLMEGPYADSYIYDIYRQKALRLAMRLIGKHCDNWWD